MSLEAKRYIFGLLIVLFYYAFCILLCYALNIEMYMGIFLFIATCFLRPILDAFDRKIGYNFQ